jgi:hypothetical protein
MDCFPLSEQHRAALASMRTLMAAAKGEQRAILDSADPAELEDHELMRVLKTRKFDPKQSYNRLLEILAWQRQVRDGACACRRSDCSVLFAWFRLPTLKWIPTATSSVVKVRSRTSFPHCADHGCVVC